MNIEIINSKGEKFIVRPCPFCGGAPRFGRHDYDEMLVCSNGDLPESNDNYCSAYMVGTYDFGTKSESVEVVRLWNKRIKGE